ncbi:MAG: DUF3786 domain-containing protein [Theionarchaea archaeon]|nr:DUF3786 domain-containing protein [Theionarchaea archaeon]
MTEELWTWARCSSQILSLKRRLGFGDTIEFLRYLITDTGIIRDTMTSSHVDDAELVYWILTTYAESAQVPLNDTLVPYNNLPGGYAFFGAFKKLAIDPLLPVFGSNTDGFRRCCLHFEGVVQPYGDVSFTIHALPLLPITVVFWERSEEFPARCSILYDTSASQYLATEALAHLGELLSSRLIQASEMIE